MNAYEAAPLTLLKPKSPFDLGPDLVVLVLSRPVLVKPGAGGEAPTANFGA